jgi:hypothetical protein
VRVFRWTTTEPRLQMTIPKCDVSYSLFTAPCQSRSNAEDSRYEDFVYHTKLFPLRARTDDKWKAYAYLSLHTQKYSILRFNTLTTSDNHIGIQESRSTKLEDRLYCARHDPQNRRTPVKVSQASVCIITPSSCTTSVFERTVANVSRIELRHGTKGKYRS